MTQVTVSRAKLSVGVPCQRAGERQRGGSSTGAPHTVVARGRRKATCCSSSSGRGRSGDGGQGGQGGGGVASERDAWGKRAVPRTPPSSSEAEYGAGGSGYTYSAQGSRMPPRNPPPWSPAFWLPGDNNLRNRRMILTAGALLGGSYVLRKALPESAEAPKIYVDKGGQQYLRTAAGTHLALFEDEQKRPYFLDPKGNMWYDSGDPDIGIHRIAPDGDVYALWEDPKTGEVLEKKLGNIDKDLIDVKTKEYGTITVFKDDKTQDVPPLCRDDLGNLEKCLNASGSIRSDRELEYPEMLIEGQLKDLKRRNKLFGGSKEVRPGDKDIETFRQGEPGFLGLFDD